MYMYLNYVPALCFSWNYNKDIFIFSDVLYVLSPGASSPYDSCSPGAAVGPLERHFGTVFWLSLPTLTQNLVF